MNTTVLDTDVQQAVNGLRALADLLAENPDLYDLIGFRYSAIGQRGRVSVYASTDARAGIAAFVRVALRAGATADKLLTDKWGGVVAHFAGLNVEVYADREEVCERVVTGTREVTEQVPDPEALAAVPTVEVTKTVEDVEWRCVPLLAEQAPGGAA